MCGLLTVIAKAKNPLTLTDELQELSTFPALVVRIAVSLNLSTPGDVRRQLENALGSLRLYEVYNLRVGESRVELCPPIGEMV